LIQTADAAAVPGPRDALRTRPTTHEVIAMALTTFRNEGIQYAADFFTEETISLMLQTPQEVPLTATADDEAAAGAATAEAAVDLAWAELADDPDVQKAIAEKKLTQAQLKTDLANAVAAPLGPKVDTRLEAALKVDYQTRLENGAYVHLLNGQPILTIPASANSAPIVSANADAIIYGCFLVIDVLSIVAAAASVHVELNKTKVAKSLQGPLGGFLKRLMNPAAVRELQRLEKAGKKLDLIKKVLFWLRGSTNLKTVVGTFLKSLSWLDYAVAVVQLVASVLLLIGTGGASLAAKVMQLAAAVALFIADLIAFIRALVKK
jgi:hypothetical protein